jgi:NADH dehydrogenase FAD-containing subunit
MTSTMVTGIDDCGAMYVSWRIPALTVIWAAGVTASPLKNIRSTGPAA